MLLIIIGIFIGVVVLSIIGIPMGSSADKIETMGLKQDGRQIISQQIHRYRLHLLSPEGPFRLGTWDYTFYYELKGDKKNKLDFFTDADNSYKLMKPILPIYNSDKWAAFRLLESEVEYEKVGLLMYIFDSRRIHHTFNIKNAIRVSRCAEEWENADSYSISQGGTNGIVTVNTLDGLVSYDPNSDKLVINRARITK